MSSTLLNNLVSWWSLDETSGVRFDSHGNNDFPDPSSAGYRPGKINNAADFNGTTNYFQATSSTPFKAGARSFAGALWIDLDSLSGDITFMALASGGTPSNWDWQIGYDGVTTNKFRFIVGVNTLWPQCIADTFGTPSTGTSYHIYFEYHHPTNTMGISINNGTLDTFPSGGTPNDTGQPFLMGAFFNLAQHVDGYLDEVAFWGDRILTTDERTKLYNYGVGISYLDIVSPPSSSTNLLGPHVNTTSGDVVAADIALNKIAYSDGERLVGTAIDTLSHWWNETSIQGTAGVGQLVTGWNDKIGSINLSVAGTAANLIRGTENSVEVVENTGLGRLTTASNNAISQTFTFLIVSRISTTADNVFMTDKVGGTSSDDDRMILYQASSIRYCKQNGSTGTTTVTADTNLHVWIYVKHGGIASIYEDGVLQGVHSSLFGMGALRLFSDQSGSRLAVGTTAEVKIWDGTAITDSEISDESAAMQTKWGIA